MWANIDGAIKFIPGKILFMAEITLKLVVFPIFIPVFHVLVENIYWYIFDLVILWSIIDIAFTKE